MSAIYVGLTILFTVYAQIVLKWQVGSLKLPDSLQQKLFVLLQQFLNPWVISAFGAAFLASLCWMATMTQMKLSDAYPFMSLSFVLILVLSAVLFGEAINTMQLIGTGLVVAGLIVITR